MERKESSMDRTKEVHQDSPSDPISLSRPGFCNSKRLIDISKGEVSTEAETNDLVQRVTDGVLCIIQLTGEARYLGEVAQRRIGEVQNRRSVQQAVANRER